MNPELRGMLLACAGRAEELGDPAVATRLRLMAAGPAPARPEFRLEYANEPWNRPPGDLGYRNYPVPGPRPGVPMDATSPERLDPPTWPGRSTATGP